jgi:hypothetical protein
MIMKPQFKFGWNTEEPQPYKYPNVWSREKTTGPERLVIAPSSDHVSLMIELSSVMNDPFGILYVLVVPRGYGDAARYQSSEPVVRQSAIAFLTRFEKFFEGDGRHHLWLASISNSDQLVYDKHNVIYAYGNLPVFEELLDRRGMEMVDEVRFPSPHIHNYYPEFDEEERNLLRYWEWKQLPLAENDDY